MEVIKITYKSGEVRYLMNSSIWKLTHQVGNATRFAKNSHALIFLANVDIFIQLGLKAGTSKFNEIEKIEFENVN